MIARKKINLIAIYIAALTTIFAVTSFGQANNPPVLNSIGPQSTTENVLLSFGVTASDIESTPALTPSVLPSGANFIDNGNGTGSFTWTPTYLQSGTYPVTFTATDDSGSVDTEIVTITVNEAGNQLPILASIGAQSTTENVLLSFGVTASDIESTPALTTSALPSGANFTDNGNGTGSFSWTPTYLQSGSYPVTFTATDDSGSVDTEIVTITVTEAGNQLPILASIGAQSTTENVLLSFGVTASDIESTPALTTSTLPSGANFVDNGNGTGSFTWTPTYLQSGTYPVTFTATDDSGSVDTEIVTITVNEAGNQLPILASIGAQSTTENILLSFAVSASDIESTPALTTSTLPTGANFIDNGNGTGSFTWTPTYLQSGTYPVTFTATDDSGSVDTEIVTITVTEAGNQLPILASIGAQSTTENVLLSFGVTASDIESTPTLTTSALPSGANFVDNGNGTGSFTWTPTYLQSGSYPVTFTATDDSSSVATEIVTITVNEAGNQLPILASIGAQSTTENVLLSFGVTASDIESTPTLTTSALPSGANFIDNGNGTGSFTWTPTYLQSGSYPVTFTATDDSGSVDTEIVTITVNEAGNQLPILASIGAKSTTENVLLSFGVTASDIESTPTLTTSALPSGANFVDNGNGTGSFTWTPTYLQSGSYPVTFTATDDSGSVDTEIVTITVTEAGNQLPILASIGAQSTTENVLLSFGVTASDIESTPALTTSTLPSGANFTDNGNGTGSFTWTPTYLQSGNYPVTFTATDDSGSVDTEIVTITVNEAGNQLPVLASIGAQSTTENVLLSFGVTASDIESTPALTTSALPSGANFVDNGNGTGSFTWTPTYLQSGSYPVTFTATDDSGSVDTEIVTITVNEAGNQLPILASIGAKSTTENVLLSFGVTASDIESTPALTTSALPSGANFVDNGNGTGSFTWTPTYLQSGSYPVTFTATDDSGSVDTEIVTITVNEAGNQLPILASIGAKSTTENVLLSFGVTASDIESTPTLTTSALPSGANFVDNGNGTGSFTWTPTYLQSGSYPVTFTATDDSGSVDTEIVTITVNEAGNQLPILTSIGAKSTTENVLLSFGVTASDIESTPALTTSTLPSGANFIDNGNGTGSFTWTPTYLQSGSYPVTFTATDDSSSVDTEIVTITVNEAGNQLPILASIGPRSTHETENLNFTISATDIESIPTLSNSALPDGASFVNNGNGTGTFNWTPNFSQSGVYIVTFTATDDSLGTDFENVSITVTNANQTPVLATIGPRSIDEGLNLNFGVSASDPDGTTPHLTASSVPSGAVFTDNGNGTGTFNWTPDYTQAGIYNVTFTATDDSLAVDFEIVTITVEQVNLPPILTSIGGRSTTENVNLNFAVTASDPDSDIPALTTSALPSGASFIDNGDGTGTFNWTPNFLQSGNYPVTFTATDDSGAVDAEIVTITVNEAGNQLPILASIGAKSTPENVNLVFGISAADIESTPSLSAAPLPTGANFTDNGDGTGTFTWTPDYAQSGNYNITFTATDDSLATDFELVTITVANINLPPILTAIGPRQTDENINLHFIITASDPDGFIPLLTATGLPSGASFIDNSNGTGAFDWTPDYTQAGIYNVTFNATDDSSSVDFEIVEITVNQVNLPPVLATIGSRSTTEGINLNFVATSSDPDSDIPAMSTGALPSGASFIDNGNGTGTFNWTTVFNQAGIYQVMFYAVDDSLAADSEQVTINILESGNHDPILAAIGNKLITEGVNLNFSISAVDPDSTVPSFTTTTLPSGASFIDNGNGTGTFNWTPNFTQAGGHFITFTTTDGSATDFEQIVINVLESGNQAPVFATVGAQSTTENVNLAFTVTATDPDATTPVLTYSTLPSGASVVLHGNGTGDFSWTPTYLQSGAYQVSFYATDGVLSDTEVVNISVIDAGNQPPVLVAIGARSTTENVLLNFSVSSTDAESIPDLTTSALPTGANFIDNGNGTGSFTWTPNFLQSGTYPVTFTATDDSSSVDTEIVTITVNEAGNQLPILASIGARSTTENVLLSFAVSASDIESTPALTTSVLPGGANFIDNGNGTGSFTWTPTYLQSGTYPVTFTATDDSGSVDTEIVTITVNEAGNQLPILASIGAKSTTENVLLSFGVTASDIESTPALTTSTLPSGANFIDNGNGTGSFTWTPNFLQSGIYPVTFTATDDSGSVDTEIVTITVNEAGNRLPILASIGARSTTENVLLSFAVSASDIESTPALTTSVLPSGANFTDNGNGTGSFTWTPTYLQSGTYPVTFTATDDSGSVDTEVVTITVNEAGNQLPILTSIGARLTTENINLNFVITSSDAESIPTLTTTILPSGANFIDNGNGTGSFTWTPTYLQSGIYPVTFTATDDSGSVDIEIVTITVTDAGNQLPVLATIGNRFTSEELNLNFVISATDIESIPSLTTSALPTGATFIDNGNGTGTFNWTPDFLQSGTYPVTFTATDDSLATDFELVSIVVTEGGNQLPILASIGTQTTNENVNLNFVISATDIESIPNLTTSALPSGATFIDNGNGTGTFNWTPTFLQSGTYPVTFTATDDSLATDFELVSIVVTEGGNQLPILTSIGTQTTNENVNLNFVISATDIESIPSLTTSTLPTGATFVNNGNGTGTFNWTPDFLQSGTYPVTFTATDDSLATDFELVSIVVTEGGNQLPILASIGTRTTNENVNLNFVISATDIESIPSLTTSTLPTGATFVNNGNGTGTFNWTPDFLQSGTYPVTFTATDDSLATDFELVSIVVTEAGNQPPVLASIGPRSTNENVNLTFIISASDLDQTIPQLSGSPLPTGASFTDNGNGTGTFNWTPDYTQSGNHNITFTADDGIATDVEIVTITVNDINRPPVSNAGSDQFAIRVGTLVTLDGSGSSDPDLDILDYSWVQTLGTPVTLSSNTDMQPTFTPVIPGLYEFELTVYDGEYFSTTDVVQVTAINSAPPEAVTDLAIAINAGSIDLGWSEITLDTDGILTQMAGYIIYRGDSAYFTPQSADSIGVTDALTFFFTDNNLNGADVVGDVNNQYFYTVVAFDIYGNRAAASNRVGEYDYQIITTATTDYNLICIPFENTGITNADQLIDAIGRSNVLTVNNYRAASQSFESRFAAGFGVNFAVTVGGIYQVNAAAATILSVAGRVPAAGTVSYQLQTTATTDYAFLSIPFERETDFLVAQDVLNDMIGNLNTLNRYNASSQSYESRFAAGFGVNFIVKAGMPYQANVAANSVFPGP